MVIIVKVGKWNKFNTSDAGNLTIRMMLIQQPYAAIHRNRIYVVKKSVLYLITMLIHRPMNMVIAIVLKNQLLANIVSNGHVKNIHHLRKVNGMGASMSPMNASKEIVIRIGA